MWIGPEDHRVVGERLERLRRDGGVTQVELASRLGKPQSFVSSFESGQRRLDLLEFLCIVSALGGDPERIFQEIHKKAARIVKRAVPSRPPRS